MNRERGPRLGRGHSKSMGQQYLETFGEVLGAKYYSMGLNWHDAKMAYAQHLQQQRPSKPASKLPKSA